MPCVGVSFQHGLRVLAEEPSDTLATVTVQIDDEESTVRFVDSHRIQVTNRTDECTGFRLERDSDGDAEIAGLDIAGLDGCVSQN